VCVLFCCCRFSFIYFLFPENQFIQKFYIIFNFFQLRDQNLEFGSIVNLFSYFLIFLMGFFLQSLKIFYEKPQTWPLLICFWLKIILLHMGSTTLPLSPSYFVVFYGANTMFFIVLNFTSHINWCFIS
jgi:hypothetical protein